MRFQLDAFEKKMICLLIGKTVSSVVRTLVETLESSNRCECDTERVGVGGRDRESGRVSKKEREREKEKREREEKAKIKVSYFTSSCLYFYLTHICTLPIIPQITPSISTLLPMPLAFSVSPSFTPPLSYYLTFFALTIASSPSSLQHKHSPNLSPLSSFFLIFPIYFTHFSFSSFPCLFSSFSHSHSHSHY